MSKRYRWECPMCGRAKLASSRPKRNATVRYCLPCSEREGVLVERSSPVLASKRAAKAARAKVKRVAKKAREDAKYMRAGRDLRKEVARCCKVAGVPVPRELVVRARRDGHSTGYAYYAGHKVVLSVAKGAGLGQVLALVAHEVAHLSAPGGHHPEWRAEFLRIVREAYGVDAGDNGANSHGLTVHAEKAIGAQQ